ncbi:pseudaminic acid synthase [bacterium 210820-DFI.6.37]|nr:pseudaminic acid synthase [bacterium 210820-DFI.6.37]
MKKVPYIVAEISANHGHDIGIIKQTILKAAMIGCDAVKIQTYTPDTITLDCDNKYFQINTGTLWDGTTLYKLYQEAYTPWEWHEELFAYAKSIGITLFSTPFDRSAVDLLEKCGNPIYKIASFEITDIPLIYYAASKHKPMVISTGIATKDEIKEAVQACHEAGNYEIYLLKCTSEYPARIKDANLKTMVDMANKFHVKIGLSDHTQGHTVAVAAAALGAELIEKHFILDKKIGGPDASFSMEPEEFKIMIEAVRATVQAVGKIDYSLTESKKNSRKYARSLFVVEDVREGDLVTEQNVRSIRPSDGLEPKYYQDILGKTFKRDIKRGTPLDILMINDRASTSREGE